MNHPTSFPPAPPRSSDLLQAWREFHSNTSDVLKQRHPDKCQAIAQSSVSDIFLIMEKDSDGQSFRLSGRYYAGGPEDERSLDLSVDADVLMETLNALSNEARGAIAAFVIGSTIAGEYHDRYVAEEDEESACVQVLMIEEDEEDEDDGEAEDTYAEPDDEEWMDSDMPWREDMADDMPWQEEPNIDNGDGACEDEYDEVLLQSLIDDFPDLRVKYVRLLNGVLELEDVLHTK